MTAYAVEIAFQPDIYKLLKEFKAFDSVLKKHLAIANETSGSDIGDSITEHATAHFIDPSGQFVDTLQVIPDDPYLTRIGSDLPYANRINEGFHGTDSLGRVYDQEGYFFMQEVIEDAGLLEEVANNYILAISNAWNEAIGGQVGNFVLSFSQPAVNLAGD